MRDLQNPAIFEDQRSGRHRLENVPVNSDLGGVVDVNSRPRNGGENGGLEKNIIHVTSCQSEKELSDVCVSSA